MRYRGGGIGHKYMRAIEQVYENMSRERKHHKERKCKHVPLDNEAMDVDDASANDGESDPEEPTRSQTRSDQHAHQGGQHGMSNPDNASGGPRGDGGDGHEEESTDGSGRDEDDEEGTSGSGLDSSGVSDSDDVVSGDDLQDESHGFGDL